ncbi:MAG: alanine racemase [Candidatus Promineifilaceae bacterium]
MEKILDQIEKPTLLLDRKRAERNIDRMVTKADRNEVLLRPHFKTHQSAEIGEWFRKRGVEAITVSSIDMAEYFIDNGWHDVTVAFPANLRQISRLNTLAKRAQINSLVESEMVVRFMDDALDEDVAAWLKIDSGYHRTGIPWDDDTSIGKVALAISQSEHLQLRGILTHAGHTYGSESPAHIRAIYAEVLGRMKKVKGKLASMGLNVGISVGDTPGCSIVDDLGDVDEIRPGNFVFFDLSQLAFGSCRLEDIAVAVACPVVAKHPDRRQIVIYGGAVHLSKESMIGSKGQIIYGQIATLESRSWSSTGDGNEVISVSQEHGIVQATETLFERTKVGDILLVLPVHSCLTANLLGRYLTMDGEVIEMARC